MKAGRQASSAGVRLLTLQGRGALQERDVRSTASHQGELVRCEFDDRAGFFRIGAFRLHGHFIDGLDDGGFHGDPRLLFCLVDGGALVFAALSRRDRRGTNVFLESPEGSITELCDPLPAALRGVAGGDVKRDD